MGSAVELIFVNLFDSGLGVYDGAGAGGEVPEVAARAQRSVLVFPA